ncbi:protein BEAN1 [Pseudophryne corroboree]|uniref:protein BEAN1 n=1 Tax=Pseudophryne corroboree TaxID=495146 RepID=UPI003082026C
MSIKVACTKIQLNQSNPFTEYFGYIRSSHDPMLLVSPLAVAGIVIGLVLFLSCVTIIIGSLRKDRGGDWRLENPSFDGISYAASFGDLRSVCTGDISPALEFGSYLELSASYMDFPPCYNDCVGPGVLGNDLPADNPPPYSLEDPHLRQDFSLSTERSPQDNMDNLLPSTPLLMLNLHVVPPNQIPVTPVDILKDISTPGSHASPENI